MTTMLEKTKPEYETPRVRVVPPRAVPILCDSYRVVDLTEEDDVFDWDN